MTFWKGTLLTPAPLGLCSCPKPKRAQRFTNFLKLLIM